MRDIPRHRLTLFGSVAALWILAALVKGAVRPALGQDTSEGIGLLLSTAPSLVGGLTVPLCFIAMHPRPSGPDIRRACIWSLPIVIFAELLERFLPGSTFDWLDLLASLVGVTAAGLLAWALVEPTRPRIQLADDKVAPS